MAFSNKITGRELMEASTALYFTSVQGMDTSPFAGSQEGLEGQISPRGKGNYEEIEQLWEDKWHGAAPIEGAVESMLQERPSGLHALLFGLGSKLKANQMTKRSASMDEIQGPGNVLSSLRRMISKGRGVCSEVDIKPMGSGPCEAFADWPIPRYPDDYEWDE